LKQIKNLEILGLETHESNLKMKKFKSIDNSFRKNFKSLKFNIFFFKILNININRFPLFFLKKNIKNLSFKFKLISIRTICNFTGRTKSIYKTFRVSRMVLKGMGPAGYIPGIQRLS